MCVSRYYVLYSIRYIPSQAKLGTLRNQTRLQTDKFGRPYPCYIGKSFHVPRHCMVLYGKKKKSFPQTETHVVRVSRNRISTVGRCRPKLSRYPHVAIHSLCPFVPLSLWRLFRKRFRTWVLRFGILCLPRYACDLSAPR